MRWRLCCCGTFRSRRRLEETNSLLWGDVAAAGVHAPPLPRLPERPDVLRLQLQKVSEAAERWRRGCTCTKISLLYCAVTMDWFWHLCRRWQKPQACQRRRGCRCTSVGARPGRPCWQSTPPWMRWRSCYCGTSRSRSQPEGSWHLRRGGGSIHGGPTYGAGAVDAGSVRLWSKSHGVCQLAAAPWLPCCW